MTRAEFIHQAIISMAGRVVGTDGTTEARDWEHVVNEAEELADTVERESAALFDSEGDTPLERIADAVEAEKRLDERVREKEEKENENENADKA